MSSSKVTLSRQELRELAARLTIASREVSLAGHFPLGSVKEHPAAELERIAAKLMDMASQP